MRKIVFISFSFLIIVLSTFHAYSQTAIISNEALRIAKEREVVVEVKVKKYSWPCWGVIWRTNYVFTNSHCLLLVPNGPPSEDGDLNIKINNNKAEVVKDFGATTTASVSDLVLLRTKTKYFEPVGWETNFQLGDVVFSFGKSGLAVGKISNISPTRMAIFADLRTRPGDSGSGLWSLEGKLIGLRSGYLLNTEVDLTDVRSTTIRIQTLLSEINLTDLNVSKTHK